MIEKVKDNAEGERLEFLINDFKKFRKYPQILDDEIIYTTIMKLHKDKRLIIQGDRGKWYIDEIPRNLDINFVIFDPKYAPLEEIEKKGNEKDDNESKIKKEDNKGEEGQLQAERRKKLELQLKGNSPRVILSQVEARTSQNDLFSDIDIKYIFSERLSKEDIMKFIKLLPQFEGEIVGELVIWRENED